MADLDHEQRVVAMFDHIAPVYDRLNHLLSFGTDRGWRRRASELARLGPGETAVDVGAGTGDLSFAVLAASAPDARVTALDPSRGMLDRLVARVAAAGHADRVTALVGTAAALPFGDASLDRVVAGFAVRNFADLPAGLREFRRVLRPGGRLVILELSTPPNPLFRALYRLYFHEISPRLARLLGGDPGAYRYLPASVARFPGAEGLAALIRDAGFRTVRFERLAQGIAAIHVAER